jgi:hypothetical protein
MQSIPLDFVWNGKSGKQNLSMIIVSAISITERSATSDNKLKLNNFHKPSIIIRQSKAGAIIKC